MSEALRRANVLVCGGTGCEASGSHETFQRLTEEVERRGLTNEVQLIHTGCRGFCAMGPIVIIYPEGIFY
ncbi:MAG: (2Fe-2S) ferredoxin domain-containing protein, partial [Anaerolineae bacterium]